MLPLPAINSIEIQHSCNTVSAIALDRNGSRLVTGGFDCCVKFWDLERMDHSLKSFKCLQPLGSSFIRTIDFCPSGNFVLILGCKARAKVLNRKGLEQFECPDGDFISKMAKTKGHCERLNDGCWHPHNNEEFLTCSDDGTLRVWLIDEKTVVQMHVIKPRRMGGIKAVPTSCQYNKSGQLVTAACRGGSIQMWDQRKNFLNTTLMVSGAQHIITSIAFSYSNTYLASRGDDGTLKLWDLRKFKDPIHSADNLLSRYPNTNCCFSPDDSFVLTGVSLGMNDRVGKVVFFDRNSFRKVNELEAGHSDVIRTMWHPKLNQIIATTGSGAVKIFYDPDLSYRGAKLFATKKKKEEIEMIWEHQITSPHALPLFRLNPSIRSKKQFEKDPLEARWPVLTITGSGHGGQIASTGNTLSSFTDNSNPRDFIHKILNEVDNTPLFDPAELRTQPSPIKDLFYLEHNVDEPPKKRAKF